MTLEETAVAVRFVGASSPGTGVGVGLGTPSIEASAPAASRLPNRSSGPSPQGRGPAP